MLIKLIGARQHVYKNDPERNEMWKRNSFTTLVTF